MEKKSQYKGFTPAQAKAHKKYMADFVELRARVTYAERDSIQAAPQAVRRLKLSQRSVQAMLLPSEDFSCVYGQYSQVC